MNLNVLVETIAVGGLSARTEKHAAYTQLIFVIIPDDTNNSRVIIVSCCSLYSNYELQ